MRWRPLPPLVQTIIWHLSFLKKPMGLVVLPGHALQSENTFVRSKWLDTTSALSKMCISCLLRGYNVQIQDAAFASPSALQTHYVSFTHWKDIITAHVECILWEHTLRHFVLFTLCLRLVVPGVKCTLPYLLQLMMKMWLSFQCCWIWMSGVKQLS